MGVVVENITIADVRAAKPAMIFYGVNTCWWTHREEDLRISNGSTLPCDPRGGMLLQTNDVEGFLRAAEERPETYGRGGLDAFIAAHNDNCLVSEDDLRQTCYRSWDDYNALL